jgi:hydroxymethylglutaryl-CoA lyase
MKICEAVAAKARARGVRIRGSLSTVIGCPFEGRMDPALAKDLAKAFLDMGCYQVALGDTIGVGTPGTTEALINECVKAVPIEKLAVSMCFLPRRKLTLLQMHSHDTWGSGVANVLQAVKMGIRTVDSSIAGLGGCP